MNQKITFGAFIVLNLLTATVCIKAQTDEDTIPPIIDTSNNTSTLEMRVIEQQATYPGGEKALLEYLANSIKYPAIARENGIEGTVYIEFVIGKDGSVTGANVKRGIRSNSNNGDGGCNEEALRVVNAMPNWTPGRQEGEPVKVKYTLPVKFKLQGNNITSTNTMASFTGGEIALSEYLANNLKYPKKARKKKIEGTVVVNFVVTINGKIQGATITQSLNKDCDTEALRLVNAMPKWTPATINGTPVDTRVKLPVVFKLQ